MNLKSNRKKISAKKRIFNTICKRNKSNLKAEATTNNINYKNLQKESER